MFRDIFHKLKIFFCDDDVEKIYVRDSTVIRNNEIHRMYNEILDELGDLATVVSRNYVYVKINDRTGLSIRHIIRIIGFGILLSFMLTIIPILLSYDIRDEIIELIEDMDSQIVVDTSVYKTNLL